MDSEESVCPKPSSDPSGQVLSPVVAGVGDCGPRFVSSRASIPARSILPPSAFSLLVCDDFRGCAHPEAPASAVL
eukprot:4166403-Lingulodinium_polyedra.AAC.1